MKVGICIGCGGYYDRMEHIHYIYESGLFIVSESCGYTGEGIALD
jgi:hypothetical protein